RPSGAAVPSCGASLPRCPVRGDPLRSELPRGPSCRHVRSFRSRKPACRNERAPAGPRTGRGPSSVSEVSLLDLAADLGEGLLLQLADALARQVVLVTDLLERELVLVVEAEAPAQDARLHRRQGAQQAAELLTPRLADELL